MQDDLNDLPQFFVSHEDVEPSNADIISITEAARRNKVTRQAIYVAIKKGHLKALKDDRDKRWKIHVNDLESYANQKYSRKKSLHNGELVFNPDEGAYSVNDVAKMLGVPPQKVYYATRIGLLKAHRKGAAWVVNIEDLKAYAEQFLNMKELSITQGNVG